MWEIAVCLVVACGLFVWLSLVRQMEAILECQIAKKSIQLYIGNTLAPSWIDFNQWFLRYCQFRVYAILSNSSWQPS